MQTTSEVAFVRLVVIDRKILPDGMDDAANATHFRREYRTECCRK